MLRRPPHILVTTPESLYLLLTSDKSRRLLGSVETVIVDEIHALVRDKRGSHLALTLERLEALIEMPPMRVGLSATQRPMDAIARFLVGTDRVAGDGTPDCEIIDGGHARELDLAIEVPPSDLSAVCSHEQWAEIHTRLTELIAAHRSTLIFVNTRRLAERVAHHLRELLGEEAVAAHHGSLSREIRQSAETRLKAGQLKAIVATASLEMGIDIGYYRPGLPDRRAPLDRHVLAARGACRPLVGQSAQGTLAAADARRTARVAGAGAGGAARKTRPRGNPRRSRSTSWPSRSWPPSPARNGTRKRSYKLCRRAWPFRNLSREHFDEVLVLLSEGLTPNVRRGAYLHRDQINARLRARRSARLAALDLRRRHCRNGPVSRDRRARGHLRRQRRRRLCRREPGGRRLPARQHVVARTPRPRRARCACKTPTAPRRAFRSGLAKRPGRTPEFSAEVSQLRRELAEEVRASGRLNGSNGQPPGIPDWLSQECGADGHAAEQALAYVATQLAAVGMVPTSEEILFERFFDESGGMQLVIHAPLGSRVNRAWGLALRKRFCRSFDFELQASADNDGIVLSLGPQHSVPIDNLFKMLNAQNVAQLLEQSLLAVPLFQVRWRWNVTRSLVVLRQQGGKRVPPHMQRFRSDDLLAAVFPETVGCLENHSGDVEIPDHPLVRQTMHDCLHEAMDVDGLVALFGRVGQGSVKFVGRDTREPSPFSYELLNANPYAFLDGAPLEERRTRAVATRRTLSSDDMRDLATLDPAAIDQVRREAWPLVRSADELHDALLNLVTINSVEAVPWAAWLDDLMRAGRAVRVERPHQADLWMAAEQWPVAQAAFPDAKPHRPVKLPERLQKQYERHAAITLLVRGRIEHTGPTTAEQIAEFLILPVAQVDRVARSTRRARTRAARQFHEARKYRVQRPDGPVVRSTALAAHPSSDALGLARPDPTGRTPRVLEFLARASSAGPREPMGRRGRRSRSDRAVARVRNAGRRVGISRAGGAPHRVRSGLARQPVPLRRTSLGTVDPAATRRGRGTEHGGPVARGAHLTGVARSIAAAAAA